MNSKILSTRRIISAHKGSSSFIICEEGELEIEDFYCTKCKNKRFLHEGDRVAFAGDMAHFALEPLIKHAQFKGIRNVGLDKNSKALVTKKIDIQSKSIKYAKSMKIPIWTPEKFTTELAKICSGDWGKPKKPPFSTLVVKGSMVFYLGKDKEELQVLKKYVESRGGRIVGRMTRGVAAAVSTNLLKDYGGKIKVLDRLGVPTYSFNRLKLK